MTGLVTGLRVNLLEDMGQKQSNPKVPLRGSKGKQESELGEQEGFTAPSSAAASPGQDLAAGAALAPFTPLWLCRVGAEAWSRTRLSLSPSPAGTSPSADKSPGLGPLSLVRTRCGCAWVQRARSLLVLDRTGWLTLLKVSVHLSGEGLTPFGAWCLP